MTDAPEPRPPIRLLDADFYAGDPFPAYRWMRRHEPVFWDEVGRVWGLSRHADVMHASAHPERLRAALPRLHLGRLAARVSAAPA